MDSIVRRVEKLPLKGVEDLLPAKTHAGEGITVTSQVCHGIEPRIFLSWNIGEAFWNEGYSLLAFKSTKGFAAERYPLDLNHHGELFLETKQDGSHEEYPAEGTWYYTFVLHKTILLGLSEKMSVVRFSETIPTAKIGIGRIKDRIDLQRMLQQHEVDGIDHEARLNEAELRRSRSKKHLDGSGDGQKRSRAVELISEELSDIDAMVEALYAKKEKLEKLKRDPKFKKLSKEEQQAVLKHMDERMNPGELNAGRDIKG